MHSPVCIVMEPNEFVVGTPLHIINEKMMVSETWLLCLNAGDILIRRLA